MTPRKPKSTRTDSTVTPALTEREQDVFAFLMSRLSGACARPRGRWPSLEGNVACAVLQFMGIPATPVPVRVLAIRPGEKVDLLGGRWSRDAAFAMAKSSRDLVVRWSTHAAGPMRAPVCALWPGHLGLVAAGRVWDPFFVPKEGDVWPNAPYDPHARWIVPKIAPLFAARTHRAGEAVYWLSDPGNRGWRQSAATISDEIRICSDRLVTEYLRSIAFFKNVANPRFAGVIRALEDVEREVMKDIWAGQMLKAWPSGAGEARL
ncbi:MAG: hypothetical protein ACK5XA_10255 [Tagaea sp.]